MHLPTHSGHASPVLLFLILASTIAGCGRAQTASLTAQDFRFTPAILRVSSTSSLTLLVYNAGREVHEFDSPALLYTVTSLSAARTAEAAGPAVLLAPGKSAQLTISPPPGTYLYFCRRKGHANMTGTLIVE